MRIAVHGKEFNRVSAPFIAHIFEILAKNNAELVISSKFSKYLKRPLIKTEFQVYHSGDDLQGHSTFYKHRW